MSRSHIAAFLAYAQAFELAWLTDDWSGVGACFTDDARYEAHDAGPFGGGGAGRDGVVAALRASTRAMDRRFDLRIPEIVAGPTVRGDGVWMRYALTLRRAGLPDLRMTGTNLATFAADGRIAALVDTPEEGAGARAAAYVATHGARLRPEGAPLATELAPHDARDLEHAMMRSLVRCYGSAKSHQDVDAALATCSDAFVLDTPPFGTVARGKDEARAQLEVFFSVFPDYRVTVDGIAAEAGSVACWGTAHLTFGGPFLGIAPTGRTAHLPFVSVFAGDATAVHGERFYFDLATLCAGIGVPVARMSDALAMLRAPEAEVPAVAVAAGAR